jgi:hypothetical protein
VRDCKAIFSNSFIASLTLLTLQRATKALDEGHRVGAGGVVRVSNLLHLNYAWQWLRLHNA